MIWKDCAIPLFQKADKYCWKKITQQVMVTNLEWVSALPGILQCCSCQLMFPFPLQAISILLFQKLPPQFPPPPFFELALPFYFTRKKKKPLSYLSISKCTCVSAFHLPSSWTLLLWALLLVLRDWSHPLLRYQTPLVLPLLFPNWILPNSF